MSKEKISIVRCSSYESPEVYNSVDRAVNLLGGISKFVGNRERVLIKPNILSARKPDEAVCTHPEVLRAVIKIVKRTGASVSVGDSPGGFLKNVEEVYDVSGVTKVAKEEKVDLVKFTFSRTIDGLPISTRVLDADKVISIPKFKTHEITGITGGVKNMYGAIVGLHKTKIHSEAPREEELAKIVAKVYGITKPTLTIIDGVVSMEGEGPSQGDPRRTNFIIAGQDCVAIDSLLAVLINTKPNDYAVIRECKKKGYGESNLNDVEIAGDKYSEFIIKNFKHAKGRKLLKLLPGVLANLFASQLKFWPEIEDSLCRKCNMCKSSCPVSAIDIKNGKYAIDRYKCISCMCCRELCPYKAIGIKKNWLSKMLWE